MLTIWRKEERREMRAWLPYKLDTKAYALVGLSSKCYKKE
jgi:hypothetical protein